MVDFGNTCGENNLEMTSHDEHNLHKLIGICACCTEAELLLFVVAIYQTFANLPVICFSSFLCISNTSSN